MVTSQNHGPFLGALITRGSVFHGKTIIRRSCHIIEDWLPKLRGLRLSRKHPRGRILGAYLLTNAAFSFFLGGG